MLLREDIEALGLLTLADGSPAPDRFYDVTSYNLRLGREYVLISGSGGRQEVGDCSRGTGLLRLPPFACALVSTEEVVQLPLDIAGRWGLKIRPAMSGLVFQAGPQIEPGSHTRLFGLLFNLSSTEKEIHYLTAMWSVDFERLPKPIDPSQQREPTLAIHDYTDKGLPSGSLNEIYGDYRRLQKESSSRREIFIGVALAVVVLLASTMLPGIVSNVVYNRSDVSDLFESNQRLQSEIDNLQEKLEDLGSNAPGTTIPTTTSTTTP